MPFFIFDQAYRCLSVCADKIHQSCLSENEETKRKKLIQLCKEIAESCKDIE
jgi:hypothetical protein